MPIRPDYSYRPFDPAENSIRDSYGMLTSAIVPRPIAFASTLAEDGTPNLAPFSYFNVYSTRPPLVIFALVRSGRTNTNKDTFHNCKATGEVCINLVSRAMVEQMSLTSFDYPAGVNEWERAGFEPQASELIGPARVYGSPLQLECTVKEIIELGQEGGAGNLVLAVIKRMHLREDTLNERGRPDSLKLDAVGRLGGNLYVHVNPANIFASDRPATAEHVGWDGLPAFIREHHYLTANDVARLAHAEKLPSETELDAFAAGAAAPLLGNANGDEQVAQMARKLLDEGELENALRLLMLHARENA